MSVCCWHTALSKRVSKQRYLLQRSGFLGFRHLSLLAFLHQRTRGVQGIVCDFVLLPRWLLLNCWLLVDDRQPSANYRGRLRLIPDHVMMPCTETSFSFWCWISPTWDDWLRVLLGFLRLLLLFKDGQHVSNVQLNRSFAFLSRDLLSFLEMISSGEQNHYRLALIWIVSSSSRSIHFIIGDKYKPVLS